MAYTTTPNLGLRISPTLTPDSVYNLQRIDDLAGRFVVEVDTSTAVRSQLAVTLEPNSTALGGSGIGGYVYVGTPSHEGVTLQVYGNIISSGMLLDDQAPTAGTLELAYNSDLAPPPGPDSNPYTLTFDVQSANRRLILGGDYSTVGAFSTTGPAGTPLTFQLSGVTAATMPPGVYTVATTSTTQTLTNKTIDAGSNTLLNITNSAISPTAGIVYSKLQLTNSIVDGDISTAAAIAGSKVVPSFGAQLISTSVGLRLMGPSYYVQLQPAPTGQTANWSLTLPPTPGVLGQTLITDGSGVTTWGVAPSNVGEYATTWLSGTSIVLSTGLNTTDVTVAVHDIATGTPVYTDWAILDANHVELNASSAPPVTGWRVIVFGAGPSPIPNPGSTTGVYAVTWASGTTFVATHNLSTEDVSVTVYDLNTGQTIGVDQDRTSTSAVTLTSSQAPTGAGWRVVIFSTGGLTSTIGLVAPLTSTGSLGAGNLVISMPAASGTQNGYLTSADWTLFHDAAIGGVDSVNGQVGTVVLLLASSFSDTLGINHGGTGATTQVAAYAALSPMTTAGDIEYESSPGVASRLPIGTAGQLLTVVGGLPAWVSPATSGTVTSVALTVPSFLSVSGSPITGAGTFAVSLAVAAANSVFAGPTSGGPTTPTFRALGLADLPLIPLTSGVSGVLPVANGGTGATTSTGTGSVVLSTSPTFAGPVTVTGASVGALQVDSTLYVDTLNGAVGINTQPATTAVLDIVNASGSTKAVQLTGYGSNVGVRGRYANGTVLAPTAATTGNILEFISGRGYGATAFGPSTAVMNLVAAATFSDTSQPTYISFSTTPVGSTTAVEAARIAPTGDVLIGTTTDDGVHKLQVAGGVSATSFTGPLTGNVTGNVSGTAANVTGVVAVANGGTGATTSTGTGSVVLSTSPTLVTPVLGTPTSVTLTNATGLPLTTGVTGVLPIANGGTNATTVAGARTALGVDAGAQFITSGTTYTTPAGITAATQFKFTLIGGGGGGGGTATANGCGCGGGGGGAGVVFLTGLAPSTAYTIAVGAGGTGGSATPTVGVTGGSTTLTVGATTYTAAGGAGGPDTVSTQQGGVGGAVTNCTIAVVGQNGGGVGAAGTQNRAASGGNSGFGFGLGGVGSVAFVGQDGLGGTGFGGGGAGAGPNSGIAGAGSAGAILVEFYN